MYNLDDYRELMDKCSHCSFCQSSCPVYKESLLETYVARFRVELIQKVLLEKTMPLTDRVKQVVDRCLLCTNCQQTCPASIPVPEIVINARYQIYQGKRLDLAKRFVLKRLMKKRGLKGIWSLVGKLGKKIGMTPNEIPDFSEKTFESIYPSKNYSANGKIRARVAYYVGCATNTLYSETGDAVMKVLKHNGIEVVLPKGLVCCGLPALGEGDLDLARSLMLKNVRILSALNVDAIITDCTSCGLTLKSKILKVIDPEDPNFKKAEKMASMVFDVMDYLNRIGLSKKNAANEWKYTYHVPCHNAWSPGIADAPVELFKSAGLGQYQPLKEPQQCCGAGGSFFAENRSVAQNIRAPRLEAIDQNGAETIITQCPLCRMYLADGLSDEKKVLHPIQLLAKAYDF